MKPAFEVTISPKLRNMLEIIAGFEGYGDTPEEVAQRFIWDGVNRLIDQRRLLDVPPIHKP